MTNRESNVNRALGAIGAIAFVGLAMLANFATARFGMVELPFGTMVTAGTFAAGAVLIVRDYVSDTLGRIAVLGCIALGAAASGLTSPAMIAIASGVAFLLSEVLDWAVYSPMRTKGWGRAVLASSIIAAPIDTIVFLWIAPFPLTAGAVLGQWAVKSLLALAAVALVKGGRVAVLRHGVQSADA